MEQEIKIEKVKKASKKSRVVLFKSTDLELPMRQWLAEFLAIIIVINKQYRWLFLIVFFLLSKEHLVFVLGSFDGIGLLIRKKTGLI